ncbi:MAG: DUF997 family protein [Planctomycetaceae bacterium]
MSERNYHPTFLNTRREAVIIFIAWCIALLWAVPTCYFLGYNKTPEELKTVLGIPSWVFWGIGVPWFVADVFTIWFCTFCMTDDDLGENESQVENHERSSE